MSVRDRIGGSIPRAQSGLGSIDFIQVDGERRANKPARMDLWDETVRYRHLRHMGGKGECGPVRIARHIDRPETLLVRSLSRADPRFTSGDSRRLLERALAWSECGVLETLEFHRSWFTTTALDEVDTLGRRAQREEQTVFEHTGTRP